MAREATPSRIAPAPRRPRRLAAAAGAVIAAAALCACNAISGVGEFSFDRSEFPGSGAGGRRGEGGAGGAGGEGGLGLFPTSTSTSTSTGACDGTGDCGNTSAGCTMCALAGPCAAQYQACGADADCVAFSNCYAMCMDDACRGQCAADHAAGAALYDEVATCVVCDACYADCDGAAAGCL